MVVRPLLFAYGLTGKFNLGTHSQHEKDKSVYALLMAKTINNGSTVIFRIEKVVKHSLLPKVLLTDHQGA